jgi:hypothetical protein
MTRHVWRGKTMANMRTVLDNAKKAGCGWAVRVTPPQQAGRDGTALTTAEPTVAALVSP